MTGMKLDFHYLIADRDRHGNVRFYVREPGRPKVRIREKPGTPKFNRAYEAARAAPAPERRPSETPHTLRWIARLYMASADFRRLDQASQRNRASVLHSCLDEPLKPKSEDLMGECPVTVFGPAHIRVLRDRKSDEPGAANNRLKYLSSMFGWAVEAGHAQRNPVRDVRRIKYASAGFHTWTAEEILQFCERHPPGSKARLALALLLFTGARRGDIVTLGRQHVKAGWLRFVPGKTRKTSAEAVEVPLLPELQAEIAAATVTGLTFLLTDYGQPFTAAGFGGWFKHRCREAGLDHCSAHGLRKSGASMAAENGATEEQLRAIFNWSTAKQSATYTRRARRRVLTANLGELIKFGEN